MSVTKEGLVLPGDEKEKKEGNNNSAEEELEAVEEELAGQKCAVI